MIHRTREAGSAQSAACSCARRRRSSAPWNCCTRTVTPCAGGDRIGDARDRTRDPAARGPAGLQLADGARELAAFTHLGNARLVGRRRAARAARAWSGPGRDNPALERRALLCRLDAVEAGLLVPISKARYSATAPSSSAEAQHGPAARRRVGAHHQFARHVHLRVRSRDSAAARRLSRPGATSPDTAAALRKRLRARARAGRGCTRRA